MRREWIASRIAWLLVVTLVAFFMMPASRVEGKTIEREKYMNDKTIVEVEIGSDITSIGDRAYYGCTNLESVIIPEGVKRIGESAFAMCPNLSYVSIPSTVKTIEPGAFAGDTSLTTLNFPRGNDNFYFVAGALYNPKGTRLISYLPGKNYVFYDMPDTIKYVDNYAFWGATNLKKVYVSPNVESVTPYDFAYCTGLEYVYLPESVESIQEYAFRDCKNLKYIYTEGTKVKMDETALTNAGKAQTVSGADLATFNAKCTVDGEDEDADAMVAELAAHQDGNKTPVSAGRSTSGNSPYDNVSDIERGRQVARNSHITSNTHPGNNFGVVDSISSTTTTEPVSASVSNDSSSTTSSSTTSSSTTSSSTTSSSTSSTTSSSSSSVSGNSSSSTTSSSSSDGSSTSSTTSSSSSSVDSSSTTSSSTSTRTETTTSTGPTRVINENHYDTSPDLSQEIADYKRSLTERLSGPYTGSYYGSLGGGSGSAGSNGGSGSSGLKINMPSDW